MSGRGMPLVGLQQITVAIGAATLAAPHPPGFGSRVPPLL